jgi:Ring finger domain
MQWQIQLLAQYSGHIFVLKPDGLAVDLTHADLESSLTTLHLRAENSDLKRRNAELLAENNGLKMESAAMRETRAENSRLKYLNTMLSRRNKELERDTMELAELRAAMEDLLHAIGEKNGTAPQGELHSNTNGIAGPSLSTKTDFIGEDISSAMPNSVDCQAHGVDLEGRELVGEQLILPTNEDHSQILEDVQTFRSHDSDVVAGKQPERDSHQGDKDELMEQPPVPAVSNIQQPVSRNPFHWSRCAVAGPSRISDSHPGPPEGDLQPAPAVQNIPQPAPKSLFHSSSNVTTGPLHSSTGLPEDPEGESSGSSVAIEHDLAYRLPNVDLVDLSSAPPETSSSDPPSYDFKDSSSMTFHDASFLIETKSSPQHGPQHTIEVLHELQLSEAERHQAEPQSSHLNDWELAEQIQREFDEENMRLWAEQQQLREEELSLVILQDSFPELEVSPPHASPDSKTAPVPAPQSQENSFALASQLQQEYEEEDRSIRAQLDSFQLTNKIQPTLDAGDQHLLEKLSQPTFDCGVCLETHLEDDVAYIEPCAHAFCRQCIGNHIRTKLNEHRFPIFCPLCTMGNSTQEPAGEPVPSFYG